MVEINGKHFCENCFEESSTRFCKYCGYSAEAGMSDPTMLTPGSVFSANTLSARLWARADLALHIWLMM